jgi:hypothetical protein
MHVFVHGRLEYAALLSQSDMEFRSCPSGADAGLQFVEYRTGSIWTMVGERART